MALLLFTNGGAVENALVFSRLTDHGEEEQKRRNLELERLRRARDEWNKDQMKRIDFINKRLREKNETRVYINHVDEAMLEYIEYWQNK